MATDREKNPTMTDVAKLAGVSQSTVSLVINGKETSSIPQTTKDKVWEAIRSLDYRPNAIARALQGSGSGVIGFITDELVTTNFAGNIYKGAQDTTWKKHKMLMLVNLDNHRGMLDEAIDMMLSYRVEGFVIATKYHHEFLLPDRSMEVPVVFANCFDPMGRYASFVPNEGKGAYDAVRHMIERGHTRIAFLSNELKIPATASREQGYLQALKDYGLSCQADMLLPIKIRGSEVYRAATKLLQRKDRPTAILCYNDRCAVSVYSAIADLGLKTGRDVSVVGFDNQTVITEFVYPGLTTMQLPHYEMGKAAMQYLFDLKSGNKIEKKMLDLTLVERSSVADLRNTMGA